MQNLFSKLFLFQVKHYFEYEDPNGTVKEIWRQVSQKLPLVNLMKNRDKRLVKRDLTEPDCSCLCSNQSGIQTTLWLLPIGELRHWNCGNCTSARKHRLSYGQGSDYSFPETDLVILSDSFILSPLSLRSLIKCIMPDIFVLCAKCWVNRSRN